MKKVVKNKPNTTKTFPSMFGTSETRGYLKDNPVTDNMIDWVCTELIKYARKPDSVFLALFLRDTMIPKNTFYTWCKKYKNLGEAFKEAKFYIAYNRMDGAAKRRFDRGTILHSQWRYGKEWEEDDLHQAKIKKSLDESDKKQAIHVHLPDNEKVIPREEHKTDRTKEDERS